MIYNNHDIESRDLDLLNKQFLGIVKDPDDPRKEGRARIEVISIHENIPTEDLPWAYPKQKNTYFGQDGRGGSLSVPKCGAIVAVQFNNGNPYSPEYFSVHEIGEDIRTELGKDGEYLGSHAILFDGDEELKIYFTISKGLTIELKESKINIARDKTILIEHAESQSVIELKGGDITITANSKVEITTGSKILAESNNIHIKGNAVKVGAMAVEGPAVLGDSLFLLLKAMAAAIDAKYPSTPGAISSIVEATKATALSNTVKVTL